MNSRAAEIVPWAKATFARSSSGVCGLARFSSSYDSPLMLRKFPPALTAAPAYAPAGPAARPPATGRPREVTICGVFCTMPPTNIVALSLMLRSSADMDSSTPRPLKCSGSRHSGLSSITRSANSAIGFPMALTTGATSLETNFWGPLISSSRSLLVSVISGSTGFPVNADTGAGVSRIAGKGPCGVGFSATSWVFALAARKVGDISTSGSASCLTTYSCDVRGVWGYCIEVPTACKPVPMDLTP